MLLSEFFETVYAPARLRGKSERSFILYRLCIARYGETLCRPPRVSDLTNENIEKHLNKRRDVSPATRNKELAELSAMWRLAVQKGMHEGWPTIQAENEPVRSPIAWQREDVAKILEACGKANGLIGIAPAWIFWTALVRICLDTGERIGALLECEWTWLEGNSIVIPAEVRKGSKRDKWYQLSNDTIEILRQLKKSKESNKIFYWPYCYSYIWNKYGKILEAAGVPTGRKCGFHRHRKTTASVAYQAGLDPQDILDHTDRRTTQRYLDPRFTRETQASQVLADWLRNPPPEKLAKKQA